MSRCELSSLILSTSLLTLIIEWAAVVSAATRTYPFPMSANEHSIVVNKQEYVNGWEKDEGEAKETAQRCRTRHFGRRLEDRDCQRRLVNISSR